MATQSSSGSGDGNNGTLLKWVHLRSSGRIYYIWKPYNKFSLRPLRESCVDEDKFSFDRVSESCDNDDPSTVKPSIPLLPCRYTEFKMLSHVEHFRNYKDSLEYRNFFPNPLTYMSNSHLKEPDLKVMWFGPKNDSNGHNWYGNVSYTISMRSLMFCLKMLPLKIYFVEIVDFKLNSASRFLFTYNTYDDLELYDPKQRGGPWYENEFGEHFYSANLKRFHKSEDNGGHLHDLELMIELQDDDYSQLFQLCDTEAVNHADANELDRYDKPKRKSCKQYPTSDCGKEKEICPSDWSIQRTEKKMKHLKKKIRKALQASDDNSNTSFKQDSDSDSEIKGQIP